MAGVACIPRVRGAGRVRIPGVDEWFAQRGYGVRFDWGAAGARALAPDVACLVVVDVLSFTTAVTVAVDAGTRVFPYAWRDASAAEYAREMGAELAVGRGAVTETAPWSLSPATLRRAPYTPRLVLPSPNGSSIAAAAGDSTVVAGCLRNATAVAEWLAAHAYGTPARPVAVIAAGERWPDGTLRPALEDLLGAGAIIRSLSTRATAPMSPEATTAAAAFPTPETAARAITECASGRELHERGFGDDVAVAIEHDTCATAPVLTSGAFTPGT